MATTVPLDAAAAGGAAALEARPVAFADIPRPCWEQLLGRTPAATPFARWTFHRAWWDAYGDSAHEQYLAVVPSGSGRPLDWETVRAIVPLMHRHAVEPDDIVNRTVMRHHEQPPVCRSLAEDAKAIFLGASYHADYATVLADPADLPGLTQAFADSLAQPPDTSHGDQPWDAVDLRRLREADPLLPALESALRARSAEWEVVRELEDVCPVITAPSRDWDDYLATLDKKDRHEIRRKIRRAQALGDLSVDIAPPGVDAVDAFIRLHTLRFGERGLFPDGPGGERSRHFIHRLAELERESPDGGQLHVGLVHSGPRLVFAILAFDDGQTCYLYNAGMDPAAADVSPGITGTALYLRNRLDAGRLRFDFLRGNESYKYEWGARDEPIDRLLVLRHAQDATA